MARTTISVPDDLKRRMAEAEGEGVNWSALACQAFEWKLADINTKQGTKPMQDVIARPPMGYRTLLTDSRHDRDAFTKDFGWAFARMAELVADTDELELAVNHALYESPKRHVLTVIDDASSTTEGIVTAMASFWIGLIRWRWEETYGEMTPFDVAAFKAQARKIGEGMGLTRPVSQPSIDPSNN